ncbi:DNA alkylation repair protein [Paracoccus sediminis]|uniref:3-methyladenine DNA glycosylase AlkD n=1 Tax=Paracoccus sediminis TaxID=1214787 RepID=A0A238X0L0_9RHOB|nr:DNA alkylation repair protein [Paracoccus sediminis]TBN49340.1 DNA alkylation repair protein [Paracoccus sediminis]SNR52406.1 3-methyladenine DNA glycosylase AlkD [Paracoccus sediminis]
MDELDALRALADPQRADQMLAYHKTPRIYLGVPTPQIDGLVAHWRAMRDLDGRLGLAADLWASDIHEARIAAAKLLVQARIRPDEAVWTRIAGWVVDFDGWAIADQTMIAGQKRLVADPGRLDQAEAWLDHPNMWARRAALVGTLPWAKMNNPKPDDLAHRERALNWAARLADDRDWFIQKAIAWWLRDLSKRDLPRVRAFLDNHGARMKPFARKEALRLVQDR